MTAIKTRWLHRVRGAVDPQLPGQHAKEQRIDTMSVAPLHVLAKDSLQHEAAPLSPASEVTFSRSMNTARAPVSRSRMVSP